MCSFHEALFTKVMSSNYMDLPNFNCHINERETPKTCLTNHKGSISHPIMPLVIIILRGGHTTQPYRHLQTKAMSRN